MLLLLKTRKLLKLQKSESSATAADLSKGSQSSEYDRLKKDEPTKAIIEVKDQVDNLRERSPSPQYAELSTRTKKVPMITNCSKERALHNEKDRQSDSNECDKVTSMVQALAKITKGEANEVEQHYYYTLENPEESCSDNKGKEETTTISNAGEMDYSMLQAHQFVTDDAPTAPNTDADAINASTLNSCQGEASADN